MSLVMIWLKKQKTFLHLSNQEKSFNYKRLDFEKDKNVKELFRDIYYKIFAMEEVERVRDEFSIVFDKLKERQSPKIYIC